ncbi:MAG: GIY-YIG nuclease family protein [Lachnospiraceae bacterium]|nr:GIY-YIG nuclease family protein [Lachnospiraceae bacterium]
MYVLRYNYSSNYYVGTTINFERRMEEHWKQTSAKRELSIWSEKNKSTKGFQFYWFKIEKEGVEQGEAEHCENQLAEQLVREIKTLKEINNEEFSEGGHVGNGQCVDRKYRVNKINVGVPIDERIKKYLKNLEFLDTEKGRFSMKCCRIGYVEEYHHNQRNKRWREVELVEFLNDNKEK